MRALFARFGASPRRWISPPASLARSRANGWARSVTRPAALLLYFHGGGFVAGSPETHRPLVGRLVEASGVGAFSVKYRLAPECFFPAAVRDGIDAYRALLAKGVSGSSIILAGDEAGGGLAFAVALAVRNAGLEMPGGVVALSPWADLSLSGLSVSGQPQERYALDWETLFLCARHYLRKSNPCDAYASPAYAGFHEFPAGDGACRRQRDPARRCLQAGRPRAPRPRCR